MRSRSTLVLAGLALSVSHASAQQFYLIDKLSKNFGYSNFWDISNTGVAVGMVYDGDITPVVYMPAVWDRGSGLRPLTNGALSGVTGSIRCITPDGQTLVGMGDTGEGQGIFVWNQSVGLVQIENSESAQVVAVSNDASVIAGRVEGTNATEAFRWTQADGFVVLGDPDNEGRDVIAEGISGDGSVLVGHINNHLNARQSENAFRWVDGEGIDLLPAPPSVVNECEATGVSYDGSRIVGYQDTRFVYEPCYWDGPIGVIGLGVYIEDYQAYADAVSDDGTVVAGTAREPVDIFETPTYEPFIWTEADGFTSLRDVIVHQIGFNLDDYEFNKIIAMSPDGKIVMGVIRDVPGFRSYTYILFLTPQCAADTNFDGVVSPADFSAWVAAFNAQAPACDQNGDMQCSPADFLAWVSNFNAGC